MKKDTPKRDRDSDNSHVSSKTSKITSTNTIRTDRYSSGGGGGDDSDEEFIDFIIGKYHERQREFEKKPEIEYELVRITKEINDIDDLIELAKIYNPLERKRYNINMEALSKLVEPLTELKRMIGMPKLKKSILNQVIYFLQDFEVLFTGKLPFNIIV